MKASLCALSTASALWSLTAAHEHGGEGSSAAASVSIADFKADFATAQIVPEVLAAFNPSVAFYATYKHEDDGDAALLVPGANLSKIEAQQPSEFSVEGLANAPNITAATRYLVYLIGPDAPTRASPTLRNVRHFLAGNLTVQNGATSSILSTALVLRNSTPATNEYNAPAPADGSGVHRYVYLFYVQPPQFNRRSFESAGFNATARQGFNLTQFRSLLGLGPSIGGSFFTIDAGTTGGSGQNGEGGGGSGPGPGPAGSGAASAMAGAGVFATVAFVASLLAASVIGL